MSRPLLAGLERIAVEDRRGTALVEFAILLPILLSIYLGTFQLIDGSSCKRRVTSTARAIADLTSQYATLTTSQVDSLLTASTKIMAPYAIAPSTVRVSEIEINGSNVAKIAWSRGLRIAARPANQIVNPPAGLKVPNSAYVYAEVSYTYTPVIAWITGPMTFTQTQFMLPRRSAKITLQP